MMRQGAPGNQGQNQGNNEKYQQTKVDIKNVLPIDLYEGMTRASFLVTEVFHNSSTPNERKVEDFVHVFWTVYNFTKLKVNPDLRRRIDGWMSHMKFPIPHGPGMPKNTFLMIGVNLYQEFYNELVKLGIGSMFDEPLQPPIGLTSELEDEDIWTESPDA